MSEDRQGHAAPPPGGRSVASGVRWSAVGRGGVQLLRLGVQLAVTRLLADPQDPRYAASVLGIVASALLVREFADLVADFGLGQAVIQRKELSHGFLRSVLGANLAVGAVAAAALVAGAPWIAAWFGQDELVAVLRVLAIGFFVGWAGIVHRGLLARELRFDRIAIADLASAVIVGAVAVPLLLYGWGLWAIVWGLVASQGVATGLLWAFSPWRGWPSLRPRELRGSMGFVVHLLGFNVLNFSTVNMDRAIVGRLGSVAMGHYDWTLRIVMYPVRTVTSTFSTVLTSAFSRLQHDDEALRARFLRASSAIAVVTCPMMFGLAVCARPLVATLLGEDWLPIVPYLTILAPVGLVQSLTYVTGSIYLAKGRSDWLFRWSLVTVPVLLLAYLVGYPAGVRGIATALCVAYLVLAVPAFMIPFRLIDLRFSVFLKRLAPYVAVGAAMAAAASAARLALADRSSLVQLTGTVAVGAAAYVVLLAWTRLPAAGELLRAAKVPEDSFLARRFRTGGSA